MLKLKHIFLLCLAALVLSACANKSTLSSVSNFAKQSQCTSCESASGFEARVKGLIYLSDVGFQCCADKRTLDTSVALKKVYIHSILDLPEEQKLFKTTGGNYYLNEKFNVAFYVFLKEELEARGIIVVDEATSPYVYRINANFTSFNSNLDQVALNSNITAKVTFKNINMNKTYTVRSRQEVKGFHNLRESSFYTFLLIKQLANKTASIVSSF